MGEQCYQVIRSFFQASVSDCLNRSLCCFLLCLFPSPSRFPISRHIHLTGSSSHLGVPCLRPRISDCHMRSLADLDVAHLRPSILISHPDFLSLPVAVLLHVHIPTSSHPPFSFPRVFQGGPELFSVAYWRHDTFLLGPPPSYTLSLAHNSNKGRSFTHCATVACRCSV